jgi:regulatory protein
MPEHYSEIDQTVRIEAVKNVDGGMALTISGEEAVLVVPSEFVARANLRPGVVLHDRQLAELRHLAALLACERKTLRLLAMREHSEGELRRKLRRAGFEREIAEEMIGKYRKQGALDDARFAQMIGNSLMRRRPCGRAYLCACLQRKLVSRSLAEETAQMLLAGQDETELATAALQQRRQSFEQFELERARRKAYNYLARRGFGHATSRAAFERLFIDQNEVDDD